MPPQSDAVSGSADAGTAVGGTGDGGATIAGATAAPASKVCPVCHGASPADALFCEACGYDYTTGSLPRMSEVGASGSTPEGATSDAEATPSEPVASASAPSLEVEEVVPDVAPVTTFDLEGPGAPAAGAVAEGAASASGPARAPVPDLAIDPPPGGEVGPIASPAHAVEAGSRESDVLPAGAPVVQPPAPAAPEPVDDVAAPEPLVNEQPFPPVDVPATPIPAPSSATAPAASDVMFAAGKVEWVAEIWIDPDWYAGQDSPDQLPSPGLPRIVGLRKRTSLVGRPSKSRGITPDVDCDPDTGVSRRHADLTTDGTRWWVEDLGSSNGTYVGQAGAALPLDPITGRTELGEDARVYVGSWTRIVVRRANPDEVDL